MRTFAALLFLFTVVPLASGSFQPTRDADFWRETNVDLEYASTFISDQICNANEALFTSCVAAFEQAASLLGSHEFDSILKAKYKSSTPAAPVFNTALKRLDQLADAAPENLPRELIFSTMINEQLRLFDNHAALIPVDKLKARLGGSNEEIAGIGIDDEVNSRGVVIRRVYPNTPAELAGLLPNDRILSIDGKSVLGGLRGVGSLKKLAKSPGKMVELIVERGGEKFKTTLPVANLSLRNVTVEFAQFGRDTYAVAVVRTFATGTASDLAQQLAFAAGKIKGLILDLRGNPGGSIEEAAEVMSLFAGEKKLVEKRAVRRLLPKEFPLVTDFSDAEMESWRRGIKPAVYPNLPLVVLVNSSSASASEMLAAALQDHGRAWIIGEVTFGKGSTQAVVGEPSKSKIRLIYTVSRYYRPQGASLQLIGMTPNFIVPAERDAPSADRIFLREGDVYGNLLERETFPAWTETRVAQKEDVRSCMNRGRLLPWFRDWVINKYGYEDYQKSYAFAVARCTD